MASEKKDIEQVGQREFLKVKLFGHVYEIGYDKGNFREKAKAKAVIKQVEDKIENVRLNNIGKTDIKIATILILDLMSELIEERSHNKKLLNYIEKNLDYELLKNKNSRDMKEE